LILFINHFLQSITIANTGNLPGTALTKQPGDPHQRGGLAHILLLI